MTPETCPNCGADVPPRAASCPECGADEKTGWSDDAKYQSLDLPDDSFDYDEFVQREFGSKGKQGVRGVKPIWKIVAALLAVGMVWLLVKHWFR